MTKAHAACDAYLRFLDGRDVSDASACSSAAAFIISNRALGLTEFLNAYSQVDDKDGPFGAIARVVEASVQKGLNDVQQNAADAMIGVSLMNARTAPARDAERAALYARLVADVYRFVQRRDCRACRKSMKPYRVEGALATVFADLEVHRPDFLLLCLLRTDGREVPVRQVLASARFKGCLGGAI